MRKSLFQFCAIVLVSGMFQSCTSGRLIFVRTHHVSKELKGKKSGTVNKTSELDYQELEQKNQEPDNSIENEVIDETELDLDVVPTGIEREIISNWISKSNNNFYKTEDRIIKGCQSKVWLHTEVKDGKIIYTADSDAIITKGMVALMIRVLSDQKAEDIVNADLEFINKIGLKEHLSPTRANGLVSMIKQMKLDALALSKS